MIDDELWADLTRINDEAKRRANVRPFEPYATWALAERLAAMARFEARAQKPRVMMHDEKRD